MTKDDPFECPRRRPVDLNQIVAILNPDVPPHIRAMSRTGMAEVFFCNIAGMWKRHRPGG
jgi:hypothetical protein